MKESYEQVVATHTNSDSSSWVDPSSWLSGAPAARGNGRRHEQLSESSHAGHKHFDWFFFVSRAEKQIALELFMSVRSVRTQNTTRVKGPDRTTGRPVAA
jgi:hypothetical protein